ncbi:MAG TPA: DUF1330 domain-containing protein [Vitreimonas sp.]|uniref:DUF1330 domain-containing protein n=1 Tax=Vitreimonas sp. TaxID=3069702 RepID=UPI002D40660D|nr:DUF1330 domain-containing protein [Vitreimonas sp.]HYD86925.1 DUF1330 domain-containing protein [Vitreimonas sp.]
MTAYVLVLAEPRSDKSEELAQYAKATEPLREAAGGKVVFRGPVARTIAGGDSPAMGIILEFPDAAAAASFFDNDAYRALTPLRDESFRRLQILILG